MAVHEAEVTEPRTSWGAVARESRRAPRLYDIVRPLGAGGMGTVYEARTMVDGRPHRVALKKALPRVHSDPLLRALFLAEARNVALLDHESLVQPFDLTDVADTGHFSMEFVDGWTLASLVRSALRGGVGLPLGIAVGISARVARALAALHRTRTASGRGPGLVHGDLNPSNIMFTREGKVKIVDFGLSQPAGAPPIRRRGLLGTPCYMSPEQAKRKSLDTSSDVFCLGIVLWELTTRRRLFRATTAAAAARRIARCDVPHPSRIVPSYCQELSTLLMATLEKDPKRRIGSASRFAQALDGYAREHGLNVSTLALATWVNQSLAAQKLADHSPAARALAARHLALCEVAE